MAFHDLCFLLNVGMSQIVLDTAFKLYQTLPISIRIKHLLMSFLTLPMKDKNVKKIFQFFWKFKST